MDYRKIKGTNDILPDESLLWKNVREELEKLFVSYGFAYEITPVLEPYELFVRGIGQGTDIVNKEMYSFKSGSGKDIALKPEETVVLFRSIFENNFLTDSSIQKLYYYTPIFRHERPQKGRYREFYQFGVESINAASPERDAEVIELGQRVLERFSITDTELELNSIGCRECRPKYRQELVLYLKGVEEQLCPDCKQRMVTNPLRVLDCKNEQCRKAVKNAPSTIEHLCSECSAHFKEVKDSLDRRNIRYIVNDRIVRGLDYYSRTVFEFIEKGDKLGSQSTIIGGGRYDYLGDEIADKHVPAIGFAGGFERLIMSISEDIRKKCIMQGKLNAYVVYIDQKQKNYAEGILSMLRQGGIASDMSLENDNMKKQMKNASRTGAAYTVICGENEEKENTVTIRNMETGEQVSVRAELNAIREVIIG